MTAADAKAPNAILRSDDNATCRPLPLLLRHPPPAPPHATTLLPPSSPPPPPPPPALITPSNACSHNCQHDNVALMRWCCPPWSRDKRRGDHNFTAAATAQRLHNEKIISLGVFLCLVSPFPPKFCRMLCSPFRAHQNLQNREVFCRMGSVPERPLRVE